MARILLNGTPEEIKSEKLSSIIDTLDYYLYLRLERELSQDQIQHIKELRAVLYNEYSNDTTAMRWVIEINKIL